MCQIQNNCHNFSLPLQRICFFFLLFPKWGWYFFVARLWGKMEKGICFYDNGSTNNTNRNICIIKGSQVVSTLNISSYYPFFAHVHVFTLTQCLVSSPSLCLLSFCSACLSSVSFQGDTLQVSPQRTFPSLWLWGKLLVLLCITMAPCPPFFQPALLCRRMHIHAVWVEILSPSTWESLSYSD